MRIAIITETDPVETRVAASAETVKKLVALGATVAVQSGAGTHSGMTDDDFAAAGATIAKTAKDALKDAEIVLKVRRPSSAEIKLIKKGALVLAIMDPYDSAEALAAMAAAGLTTFSMELMPRITRAQVMDVLSSQANLAGYRAVIDAAAVAERLLKAAKQPDDGTHIVESEQIKWLQGGGHGAKLAVSPQWAPGQITVMWLGHATAI